MRRGPRRRRSRHRAPFDRPTEVHESDGVCALIQTRSPPPIASHQYWVAPPGLVVRDESLIRTRRMNLREKGGQADFLEPFGPHAMALRRWLITVPEDVPQFANLPKPSLCRTDGRG